MASTDDRSADLRRRPARGGFRAAAGTEPNVSVAALEIAGFAGEFGNRSYAIRASDQTAFIIDPPRDVGPHREWAEARGLRISAVLETHLHGDFVSGARELEAATGATIVAPTAAGLIYPHRAVTDGWVVLVGDVEIHACTAAGHSDEQVMYVVVADGVPAAVFAGGMLSLAAPDDADPEEQDASGPDLDLRRRPDLFHDHLARLPRATPAYLTHPGREDATSVGALLRGLASDDLRVVTWHTGTHVAALRALNRAGAPLLDTLPDIEPLDARDVARLLRQGTWLVDVRAPHVWTVGHPPQSISVAAGSEFRRLLPHAVPPGAPVVLLGDDDTEIDRCTEAARSCGHDGIIGWIHEGWSGWRAAELPLRTTPVTSTYAPAWADAFGTATAHVMNIGADIALLDIAAGWAPDSDGELVVAAATAAEAATAASLLEARGHRVAVRLSQG